MTVKWHIRCFLALVLTLLSAESLSAEIICDAWGPKATHVDRGRAAELYPSGRLPNPDSCSTILLKGAILPGDGDRFAKILRQSHPFLSSVSLWSPGGSVEDAMKIGRLIRKGLIDTRAPSKINVPFIDVVRSDEKQPGWGTLTSWSGGAWTSVCEGRNVSDMKDAKPSHNCHCASACFLIWAAGVERTGDVLGLHRPRIEATAFAKLPPDRAGVLYRQLLSDIGRYLAEMEIPRQLIEIMTSTSSKDLRWLTYEEADSIEDMPPSIAEWVASSCGAMSKYEKDTMSKISAEIAWPKNVSQRDRMLLDQLEKKRSQIVRCVSDKIRMARDGIKEVSD
jgi:hypothetical protein